MDLPRWDYRADTLSGDEDLYGQIDTTGMEEFEESFQQRQAELANIYGADDDIEGYLQPATQNLSFADKTPHVPAPSQHGSSQQQSTFQKMHDVANMLTNEAGKKIRPVLEQIKKNNEKYKSNAERDAEKDMYLNTQRIHKMKAQSSGRSTEQACILCVGRSGVGKSSSINSFFDAVVAKTNDAKSETKATSEYIMCSKYKQVDHSLSIVDTPGFNDTDGATGQDAANVMSIKRYFQNNKVMRGCYPNLIFIVVSLVDERFAGACGPVAIAFKTLHELNLIDYARPNVAVLLTRTNSFERDIREDFREAVDHESRLKLKQEWLTKYEQRLQKIKECCMEYGNLPICDIPFIPIENKPRPRDKVGDCHWIASKLLGAKEGLQFKNVWTACTELLLANEDFIGYWCLRANFEKAVDSRQIKQGYSEQASIFDASNDVDKQQQYEYMTMTERPGTHDGSSMQQGMNLGTKTDMVRQMPSEPVESNFDDVFNEEIRQQHKSEVALASGNMQELNPLSKTVILFWNNYRDNVQPGSISNAKLLSLERSIKSIPKVLAKFGITKRRHVAKATEGAYTYTKRVLYHSGTTALEMACLRQLGISRNSNPKNTSSILGRGYNLANNKPCHQAIVGSDHHVSERHGILIPNNALMTEIAGRGSIQLVCSAYEDNSQFIELWRKQLGIKMEISPNMLRLIDSSQFGLGAGYNKGSSGSIRPFSAKLERRLLDVSLASIHNLPLSRSFMEAVRCLPSEYNQATKSRFIGLFADFGHCVVTRVVCGGSVVIRANATSFENFQEILNGASGGLANSLRRQYLNRQDPSKSTKQSQAHGAIDFACEWLGGDGDFHACNLSPAEVQQLMSGRHPWMTTIVNRIEVLDSEYTLLPLPNFVSLLQPPLCDKAPAIGDALAEFVGHSNESIIPRSLSTFRQHPEDCKCLECRPIIHDKRCCCQECQGKIDKEGYVAETSNNFIAAISKVARSIVNHIPMPNIAMFGSKSQGRMLKKDGLRKHRRRTTQVTNRYRERDWPPMSSMRSPAGPQVDNELTELF